MKGKPSIQKRLRRIRNSPTPSPLPANTRSISIGSWSIEEDSEGRLVVRNLQSEQTVIIA